VAVLPERIEFEEVEGTTFFVTAGTVLILGLGSKGDSTKFLSQTFESRESQMTKDLTATLLRDFKEDFISLFRNPSEGKQKSFKALLQSSSLSNLFGKLQNIKGHIPPILPYFPHKVKSTPRELPACYVSKLKVCQVG